MINEAFKKMLEKRQTSKGFGIFTKSAIAKDSIIFEFTGDLFSTEQIPYPLTIDNDRFLQIGSNKFIGPSGDYDDYINHSCSPNCSVRIVGSRAFLKSLCLIQPEVELTFDYSTTSSDTPDKWKLNCQCHTFNCRKIISGYETLDEKTKEKYKQIGIIPPYLLK